MDIELTAHHQGKAMDAILQQIQKLSTAEKLDLVQALWDDIEQSSGAIPVSEEAQAEVIRRAAWHQANPGHSQSLDGIALKLGVRL
jgi:putative addiction module component (TIGR02574 family)